MFDSNDKNVIDQDSMRPQVEVKLCQSLLLRYLPIPMILKSRLRRRTFSADLYEDPILAIFKGDKHE